VSTVAVVVAAVLGVAAVVFVARPFLRDAPMTADSDLAEAVPGEQLERLQAVEERDRALGALKELEFDHRTGKISDADYRELVGPLRREAAAALRALDPPDGTTGQGAREAVEAGVDPRQEVDG
jgi:hypothetical protein